MTSMESISRVLVRPIVTEKSLASQERGTYIFEVALSATKAQVKEAVEGFFKVKVDRVRVMRVKEKRRRFGPRWVPGRTWKKAIVTLKPGHKITLFEGV